MLFGALQHNLLDMPWSDWKIDPSELSIVARPDGSEWLLGSGASGKVRLCPALVRALFLLFFDQPGIQGITVFVMPEKVEAN